MSGTRKEQTTKQSRKDNLFGQLLVRRSHCTREQLNECLSLQRELQAKEGKSPRIGDLLIRKGYVGMTEVEEVLADIDNSVPITCAKCKTMYRLLPEDLAGEPRCRKQDCGALLPLRAAGPSDATLRDVGHESSGGTQTLLSVSLVDAPMEVRRAAKDPKKLFSKFVLVKELGRGGMGVVFQAWDTGLKSMVALKFLLSNDLTELQSDEVQRFLREARLAAGLSHPNICRTFDVRQEKGKYFICMQYVKGHPIGKNPTDAREAIRIVQQVAHGLHHAHEQDIVHRDIKPSNIMLAEDGTPLIMDFGIAKSLQADSQLTQTGAVIGSPSYMSPEQGSGDPSKIDRRCDVYSLGATLYQMLTGKPPFEGNSPLDTLLKVKTKKVVPPSKLVENLSSDIENICLKALAKDPRVRYQTAEAMADDIEKVLTGKGKVTKVAEVTRRGSRHSSSSGRRVRVSRPKTPQWVIPVVAGAVVLVLILGGMLVGRGGDDDSDDEPRKKNKRNAVAKAEPGNKGQAQPVTPAKASQKQPTDEPPTKKKNARYAAGKLLLEQARRALYQVDVDGELTRAKLKQAVSEFLEALEQDPKHPRAYTDCARAQILLFDYKRAEDSLKQAIGINSKLGENYALRGQLYLQQDLEEILELAWVVTPAVEERLGDRRIKAAQDLRRAARRGQSKQLKLLQALLAFAERRMLECITLCTEGINVDSSNWRLYKLRGDAAYYRHSAVKMTKATLGGVVADYSAAIKLRPGYGEALLMRGNAYAMIGQLELARADIEAALELRPESSAACWFMGSYFTKKAERSNNRAQVRQALVWYTRGLRYNSESFVNLIARATTYLALQKYDEAGVDLDKAVRINPDHHHSQYMRGGLLSKRKRYVEAIEAFKASIKINDRFYSAWFNIAVCYYNTGEYSKAEKAWEKSIQTGHPEPARVRKLIARAAKEGK